MVVLRLVKDGLLLRVTNDHWCDDISPAEILLQNLQSILKPSVFHMERTLGLKSYGIIINVHKIQIIFR